MPTSEYEKEVALDDNHGVSQDPHTRDHAGDGPLRTDDKATDDMKFEQPQQTSSQLESTTTRSSVDVAVAQKTLGPKNKWYKRLNPLKRSQKPPIPERRTVSREFQAGFFSRLTFQWMAPLMDVSTKSPAQLSESELG